MKKQKKYYRYRRLDNYMGMGIPHLSIETCEGDAPFGMIANFPIRRFESPLAPDMIPVEVLTFTAALHSQGYEYAGGMIV